MLKTHVKRSSFRVIDFNSYSPVYVDVEADEVYLHAVTNNGVFRVRKQTHVKQSEQLSFTPGTSNMVAPYIEFGAPARKLCLNTVNHNQLEQGGTYSQIGNDVIENICGIQERLVLSANQVPSKLVIEEVQYVPID